MCKASHASAYDEFWILNALGHNEAAVAKRIGSGAAVEHFIALSSFHGTPSKDSPVETTQSIVLDF